MARSQTTRTTTIGPDHNLSTPEPEPVANDSTPIWDLVIRDMHERDAEGRRKYGTPLQAGNGRDPLVDAYQEALDLVVYLRQAIEERGRIEARDPAPAEHCEISRPDIASRIMELGARSSRWGARSIWIEGSR